MAYTALYRKFRPLTFSEMVGQEHITRTLKNQIIAGRVGHAYLLNGVRGTGKTLEDLERLKTVLINARKRR